MLRIFILGLLLQVSTTAFATDIVVKEGDQILLRGRGAQVRYTVMPGMTAIHLTTTSPTWSWERRDRVIAIEDRELSSRADVRDAIRTGDSKAVVELQGPSLPIEIHLRDGSVQLKGGAHEARLLLQQGKV